MTKRQQVGVEAVDVRVALEWLVMKHLIALMTLVLLAAKPSDPAVQQILALENARNDAIVRGDAAALERMTADEYTFINLRGGIQLKSEIVKGFASGSYKYQSRQISELNVRMYGDTAVVTGRSTQQGAENGRDNSGDYRFTRVYVKRDGRWQTVAYQATAVQKMTLSR